LLQATRQEVLRRCAVDGWFWTSFVRTKDEADPANATKPFPQHLPYVRAYWHDMTTAKRITVAKSRQMFVTWATCAYMVWIARFHPNTAVLYQTQSEDDANGMVSVAGSTKDGGYYGRCQFVERTLPVWMQQPVRDPEGMLTYPNGSIIRALPGGAHKIRGKTATLIVLDEMAFLEEAKGSYTAIAPLVQKGAQLIAISTPNGGVGNFFYHLHHGLALDTAVQPGVDGQAD
jgi:phage FluMu gp28-like protein